MRDKIILLPVLALLLGGYLCRAEDFDLQLYDTYYVLGLRDILLTGAWVHLLVTLIFFREVKKNELYRFLSHTALSTSILAFLVIVLFLGLLFFSDFFQGGFLSYYLLFGLSVGAVSVINVPFLIGLYLTKRFV